MELQPPDSTVGREGARPRCGAPNSRTGAHDLERNMTRNTSAYYRAKAEDCRAEAERANSRLGKECWQFFAEEWQKLAEDVERLENQ